MPQLVHTLETVNGETGEMMQKEILRKSVENKEQFIKTYIEDIGNLAKCNGAEKCVILCCLRYLNYNTNEFILTPDRRKEIAVCGNIKLHTVNTAMSTLMKKNIIIASSKWTYTINPNIFFFGTDFDGASVIKATITYTIGNGQSTLSSSVTKRRNKKSKL